VIKFERMDVDGACKYLDNLYAKLEADTDDVHRKATFALLREIMPPLYRWRMAWPGLERADYTAILAEACVCMLTESVMNAARGDPDIAERLIGGHVLPAMAMMFAQKLMAVRTAQERGETIPAFKLPVMS